LRGRRLLRRFIDSLQDFECCTQTLSHDDDSAAFLGGCCVLSV
jgi:hypothetical protein